MVRYSSTNSSSSSRSNSPSGFSTRFPTGLSKRNEPAGTRPGSCRRRRRRRRRRSTCGSVQRFSRPSRVEKSMPAASRIRFLTRLGMQGGEHGAHRAAHAVAQDARLRRAGPLAQVVDHVGQVAVDVVVQRVVAVGVGRRAPVDQVGVEAGADEVAARRSCWAGCRGCRAG